MVNSDKYYYQKKYAKENLKRVPFDIQKEDYTDLKNAADHCGESVNGYIKKAIAYRMKSDGGVPVNVSAATETKLEGDFYIIAPDDAMSGIRISKGDFVTFEPLDKAESGDVIATRLAGDSKALIRRFLRYPDAGVIILRTENPDYPDMVFKDESGFEILGKAVSCRINLN